MAIFGNVAHSRHIPGAHSRFGDIFPVQEDLPAFNGSKACQRIDQLRLTVSVYTGNAYDLTFSDGKGYVVDCFLGAML